MHRPPFFGWPAGNYRGPEPSGELRIERYCKFWAGRFPTAGDTPGSIAAAALPFATTLRGWDTVGKVDYTEGV